MAKTELSIQIGKRLGHERERLNLTQKEVAERIGVTRSTMSNYESGFRSPDAIGLCGLADLGVDVLFVLIGRKCASDDIECRVIELEKQIASLKLAD